MESLSKVDVPSSWMWSMHSWHISRVFFKGASLFDHNQMHIFKTTTNASTWRVQSGVCSYESSWERNELENLLRKKPFLQYEKSLKFLQKSVAGKIACSHFRVGRFKLYVPNCMFMEACTTTSHICLACTSKSTMIPMEGRWLLWLLLKFVLLLGVSSTESINLPSIGIETKQKMISNQSTMVILVWKSHTCI